MTNYLSSPEFGRKTKPLRELLIKHSQWVWEAAQQTAFTEIKQALETDPVLLLFDQSRDCRVGQCILIWIGGGDVAETTQWGVKTNLVHISIVDSD